jgi:transcriptional antiterminator RfaH
MLLLTLEIIAIFGDFMEKKEVTAKRWFAMYTHSRAEKKVQESLVRLGVEVYLPIKRELRQWSDRKKWVETPIINSYIFVRIEESQMKLVYTVPGLVGYVNSKGKPAVIPDMEMEAMRRTVDGKLEYSIEQQTIRKGETIRMMSGPLQGVEGVITDIKGKTKLCITVSHVGFVLVVDIENFLYEKVLGANKI